MTAVWTVVGACPLPGRPAGAWPRFAEVVDAATSRDAETEARRVAAAAGATDLWVARVFTGSVPPRDRYTATVDPAASDGDEPDVSGPSERFTVVGVLRDPADREWCDEVRGQRWYGHVEMTSPRGAEDMAHAVVADEEPGAELLVCGVLPGWLEPTDLAYAVFVDPDRVPR